MRGLESWDPPAYIDPRVPMTEGWTGTIDSTSRGKLLRQMQTLKQLYAGLGENVPHAKSAKQRLQFISKHIEGRGLPTKRRKRRKKMNVQKSRLSNPQKKQKPLVVTKKRKSASKPTVGPFFI